MKTFICEGRKLANYLITHGSKLIKEDKQNGKTVFVFENDDIIIKNLEQFEVDINRCLF